MLVGRAERLAGQGSQDQGSQDLGSQNLGSQDGYEWLPASRGKRARAYAVGRTALTPFAGLKEAFRTGEDSPRHFLERCLEAMDRREPEIQAFVCVDAEAARIAADDSSVRYRSGRPLSAVDGMPVGVKDIIETVHLPTQMNSPIYAGFRPRRDAACVVALKAAGAIILGKTVTTEFACGRSGPTRNPYDMALTPGGSSSGSAAAVGGGLVPGALGTQTQASLIRPASYCGAYGFKPSHGLLRFDGCAPLAASLDTLGIFGASLEDAWAITSVLAAIGPDLDGPNLQLSPLLPQAQRPGRLVRLDTVGWSEVDGATREAFEQALAHLSGLGVDIVDRRNAPDVEELEQMLLGAPDLSMLIFAYESQWPLKAYAALGERLVGERVHDLIARAGRISEADYRAAVEARHHLRQKVAAVAHAGDGFVALASSGPAIADISYTGSRSYPVPWSLVGGPSFALPVMASASLPVGLQLMGPMAWDQKLAATAAWVCGRLLQ